jgi:hypothetical protein
VAPLCATCSLSCGVGAMSGLVIGSGPDTMVGRATFCGRRHDQNGSSVVGGNNLGAGAVDDLFLVEMIPADDPPVAAMLMTDLPAAVVPTPSDERHEVQTLAELFEYVSAAWDSGGSSYCATKTWFGCGLDDVFQGLASKEGLSATERSALSTRMRNAMPPCRNCWCNGRKPAKCVA